MLRLTAKIVITGRKRWTITTPTKVEIVADTDTLTDTCTITLPRHIRWDGSGKVPFGRGDAVDVFLGYDGKLERAFMGYVCEVTDSKPIVVRCEDEMFLMKRYPAQKKAYRSATIRQLIDDQRLAYRLNIVGEQSLGAYRMTQDTVAMMLGQLHRQGIRSFFRTENDQPTLYAGILFDRQQGKRIVVREGVNLIDRNNLKPRLAADTKIRLVAISLMPDGKKKERVEVGDGDGERRTMHTYNRKGEELKSWAEAQLARIKKDGLTGSLTTFGAPLIDKLDSVAVHMDDRRQGVYLVKKNKITYGPEGFRQEVTLGHKIAD